MKQELRAFITDNYLFGQSARFGDEDSLTGTGIIDSTGVLEMAAFLEERYGIIVENEDLLPDNLDSIAKLTAFLGSKGVQGEEMQAASA